MSEQSAGCRAAWERWRVEQIKTAPSNVAALFWNTNPYSEPAFAAGYAAALASLDAQIVHLEELAHEAFRDGDGGRWLACQRILAEARNSRQWVAEGITCGVESHQRCQEGQR